MSQGSSEQTSRGSSTTTKIVAIVAGIVFIVLGLVVFRGPQFSHSPLPGIDFKLGKVVVMIGIMLIMFPLIEFLYVTPLKAAIDARNGELERTFAEAEDLRARMDTLRTDYEARLSKTEAAAREQIQAQIREATSLKQTLMAEASARADALVEQARQQIEQEKAKAILEIRGEVVNLTMLATERLIGENLNDERNRRLLTEFVERVEVAP